MDVTTDPATNQIAESTCWGHVEIRQKNQISYSHRADYRQTLGKVLLIGHPRLVMLPAENGSDPF
jgi:hypothetical protein